VSQLDVWPEGLEVTNAEGKAAFYRRLRAEHREGATEEFLSRKADVARLAAAADELVANVTYFCVGKDLREIVDGLYIGDLIVSFCRSHFTASDLIAGCELVEAGVILRKQMELVSRLHELRKGIPIDDLVGQVPNVRHLSPALRRVYGEYSALTHSSNPKQLQLLGEIQNESGFTGTPLYPAFQDNAYVALFHSCVLTMEFCAWSQRFYAAEFSSYEPNIDRALGTELIEIVTAVFEIK
jgi:hypothetical protein